MHSELHFFFCNCPVAGLAVEVVLAEKVWPSISLLKKTKEFFETLRRFTTRLSKRCPWMSLTWFKLLRYYCRDSCWMISICAYIIGRKNYSPQCWLRIRLANSIRNVTVWTVVDSNHISIYWWLRLRNMGSLHVFFIRYFFPSVFKMYVLDVLHRLVIYLWTKRYKCCIKSANYVMLTYVCSLTWFTSPTFSVI